MDMITTFTDYIPGFKNLVYLHEEAHAINADEREILLSYLTLAKSSPENAINNVDYFVNLLQAVDTNETPIYC